MARKVTQQPMYEKPYKRTIRDTQEERDLKQGVISVQGAGQKKAEIFWDLNEEAKEARVCKVKIGNEVAYVQVDQLMKYLRWV